MPADVITVRQIEQITGHNYLHNFKDQLQQSVYGRSEAAFAAGNTARDAVRTRASLRARQRFVRQAFLDSLGGLPPLDTPLRTRTVGHIAEDGFDIEKLIYQSRPGTYVTANLYLPHGIKKPRGAVLFVCGHHEQAKHVAEYQVVCRHLAQAFLFSPTHPNEFRAKALRLAADPQLRTKFGGIVLELSRTKSSIEQCAATIAGTLSNPWEHA